jgi:hypothetical protein
VQGCKKNQEAGASIVAGVGARAKLVPVNKVNKNNKALVIEGFCD